MLKIRYMVLCIFLAFTSFSSINILAQSKLTEPELSQAASISQTIGLTKITIDYHRPLVRGRKIWDGLVPYGQIWRAGADENTTIEFSDAVKINGNNLSAGKYGLHMIPDLNEWVIIFSKDNAAWGSFFYDKSHDALRINVKPESNEFTEALTYSFENPKPGSVTAVLEWEKLKVQFNIEVDVNRVVVDNFKKELTGLEGFDPEAFLQAANYCLYKNYDLDQGLQWADRSINMKKGFANLYAKAEILNKMGKTGEGKKIKDEAMKMATEEDLNNLARQYFSNGEIESAIEIFNLNLKMHPKSLGAYLGLGSTYREALNYDMAIKSFEKAKELAPKQALKDRIQEIINGLKNIK